MEADKVDLKRKYISKWISIAKDIFLKNLDTDKFFIFIFGSRSTENFSHSSDLDIGILGEAPVERKQIIKIKHELEESIVPFHIDIVDFHSVDENFKQTALQDIIVWNKPKAAYPNPSEGRA